MRGVTGRVKIVATLGPATDSIDLIESLIMSGTDVVRLNFSHGSHAWHQQNVANIRAAAAKLQTNVAIMADLQGPKVRITAVEGDNIELVAGSKIKIGFSESAISTKDMLYIACAQTVFASLKVADLLLLDDGKLALKVEALHANSLTCTVVHGGSLTSKKGVSAFGVQLDLPALTPKDLADIELIKTMDIDYLALSFVQTANDVKELKDLLGAQADSLRILAKFETAPAIEHMEAIIDVADGIMVARGDLAIAVGAKRVPWLQKQLLNAAIAKQKPAIVATQMMESMVSAAVPTRAEVSDVANAILDGADAVMLSAETAVGKFPVQVVETVAKICWEAGQHAQVLPKPINFQNSQAVLAWSAVEAAHKLKANYLVTLTETGSTALLFSKFGIEVPIIGLSRNKTALAHMQLYKNVTPFFFDLFAASADLENAVLEFLLAQNLVKSSDTIVLTKGGSLGVVGETNSMFILGVK